MSKGFFVNAEGYDLVKDEERSTWRKAIYHFTLAMEPLTFIDSSGDQLQPNRSFYTDMGSVPRWCQMWIPKDRVLGFYLHDAGYCFKGLWIGGRFQHMSRREIDDLLYEMCLCDPIPTTKATAWAIWAAVRARGGSAWGKGDVGKGGRVGGLAGALMAV